jgi:hypothetical protein
MHQRTGEPTTFGELAEGELFTFHPWMPKAHEHRRDPIFNTFRKVSARRFTSGVDRIAIDTTKARVIRVRWEE